MVFFDAFLWLADEADEAVVHVLLAVHIVHDFVLEGVVEEGVYGEVAS